MPSSTTQVVINPRAGRGAGARLGPAVVRRLTELGIDCEAHLTKQPGHAIELAERCAREGARTLVVVGGDGSVFEAANGILRSGKECRLGVVPMGTGNDFVKMLDARHDWQKHCTAIAENRERRIDVGRCNDHYFMNGIGFGFDAQVAVEANNVQSLRGNAVYFYALLKILLTDYRLPEVHVTHDEGRQRQRVTMVAMANGQVYGGAFKIAPRAAIDDGKLEVVLADGLGRLGILGLLPHVMLGTHLEKPAVTYLRSRRVKLESDLPMPVHADGEIIDAGATLLDIELLPGALTVLG